MFSVFLSVTILSSSFYQVSYDFSSQVSLSQIFDSLVFQCRVDCGLLEGLLFVFLFCRESTALVSVGTFSSLRLCEVEDSLLYGSSSSFLLLAGASRKSLLLTDFEPSLMLFHVVLHIVWRTSVVCLSRHSSGV